MQKTFRAGMAFSAAVLILCSSETPAQTYPTKSIRIIASGVGGGSDFLARQLAQGISGPLGQPVVVENRGGGGVITGEVVSKAAPDGYTLLSSGESFLIQTLLQKTPFEPNDFTPVTMAILAPNFLVVTPTLPVKTVKDLIALAKARPGELNYSSSTTQGSSDTIAAEFFKSIAGVNIVRIPYKVQADEITDLITGRVQLTFQDGGIVGPHLKSGKLKALAVTTLKPTALAPGLPTVAQTLPGFESVAIFGIFAPAKTPAPIVNRLNQEMVRVLQSKEVKDRFFAIGIDTVGSTPEQFANQIKSDMVKHAKLFKEAGFKAE